MRSRYHSTLMLSAALAACGEDTGRTSDVQVQMADSAGVRIVEYVGVPEVEPPFVIAEEPVYRHGANPGDYEFQRINVGRLFPDGSAVVEQSSVSPHSLRRRFGRAHREPPSGTAPRCGRNRFIR